MAKQEIRPETMAKQQESLVGENDDECMLVAVSCTAQIPTEVRKSN